MNLTPTRLALLTLLRERGTFCVTALADALAPRKHGWAPQGAARWGGGYIKPLEQAGLVLVNRSVRSGVGDISLTAQGLAALSEYEARVHADKVGSCSERT